MRRLIPVLAASLTLAAAPVALAESLTTVAADASTTVAADAPTMVANTVSTMASDAPTTPETMSNGKTAPVSSVNPQANSQQGYPKIKFGGRLYANFGVQTTPNGPLKADGTGVGFHGFDVTRAYMMFEGTPVDWFSFYTVLDASHLPQLITAADKTLTAQPGRLTEFVKYADAEFRGLWGPTSKLRLGVTATPWITWEEALWDYRAQGTIMADRERLTQVSDFGVSLLGDLPGGFGDYHVGAYNGEGFTAVHSSGRLTYSARLTLQPFKPMGGFFAPLGVSGYGQLGADKDTAFGMVHYRGADSPLGLAFGVYSGNDKVNAAPIMGMSAFGTLKLGWIHPALTPFELLSRYESYQPNTAKPGSGYSQFVNGISYSITKKTRVILDNETRLNEDPAKGTWNTVYVHTSVEY